jgi:hypothetical protein
MRWDSERENAMAGDAAAEKWAFCTLGRGAFAERMAEIRILVGRFGGEARAMSDGAELSFTPSEGLEPALASLVEKERQCCSTLRLSIEADQGSVRLRVIADGDDRPTIQAFARALATPK